MIHFRPGKMLPVLPTLRIKEGPLTQDLIQHPGGFGLGKVPERLKPDGVITSVCGYCAVGCGLRIHLRNGHGVNLTPNTDYPVNLGMACPKGWEALRVLDAADRATIPLLRNSSVSEGSHSVSDRRSANPTFAPISWDIALRTFCERFKKIQADHGPASVAFLGTGQIPSEELAFLGCLSKFGMGMIHGDGNTRQCMATSVAAYKQSFGFDAPPYTYRDFEQSDVLVFVGANPCTSHPILWQRVLRNPHQPRIIVIDPRRTETAMGAAYHLALRPKSDLVLLYGIARELLRRNAIDQEFIDRNTSGFAEFAAHVQPFDVDYVTRATAVSRDLYLNSIDAIAKGNRVSFWWTMGVNQSYQGTRTAQAIINLALMTGNIGREGTGANSITGQCNAMGSRLFSNTTNLLGGHDFQNPEHRRKIARVLEIPEESIPKENGWAYDQILAGIESGAIRGLWIVATNTAHSWIQSPRVQQLLAKLDFLVVQDMYHTTETARHADLLLPAAGWGEKEGTFINSERRICTIKRVRKAPGEALADFSIFRLIAEYWGCGEMFSKWTSPAAAFELLKAASQGQPCDITGIEDYAMLERCGGVQWPWTKGNSGTPEQERRLFGDGKFFHPDGKAKFLFCEPVPLPESPDDEYPFILLTGRGSVSQWHTQTRTAKSPVLRKLYPRHPYLEINPLDARRLNLSDGALVRVKSRRGMALVRLQITAGVSAGQVFMPMHDQQTNFLTREQVDPYSRQPSFKDCAVSVEPADQGPKK